MLGVQARASIRGNGEISPSSLVLLFKTVGNDEVINITMMFILDYQRGKIPIDFMIMFYIYFYFLKATF